MITKLPKTSRGMRPHIVLAGKCNAGKSSLANALVEQDLSIVSATPGTTTDPVLKSCELLPYGPVVFVDTAGSDDATSLGAARAIKTAKAVQGSDIILYVMHSQHADHTDTAALTNLHEQGLQVLPVISHSDLGVKADVHQFIPDIMSPHTCSAVDGQGISQLREAVAELLRRQRSLQKTLLQDLIKPFKLILLIVPIDLEAPAGRLILPQVQTIREILDSDSAAIVVKEREVSWALDQLKRPPDLVITDSQVVLKASGAVPRGIPLTTFSILFSRLKGDLNLFVENARRIDSLQDGSRILVTETCSHHAQCDDIGRVKIPRWLRQYTGKDLYIEHSGGRFPDNISDYDLLIHCGACMITRNQMLARMRHARTTEAPITNYGIAISHLHGLLDRVLEPFG